MRVAVAATVMVAWMTVRMTMNKPSRPVARPLRDLLGKVVGDTFTRQGFASAELVTRWPEIAGAEIAAYSEPIKIQWPRPDDTGMRPPGHAGSPCRRPGGDRDSAPRRA